MKIRVVKSLCLAIALGGALNAPAVNVTFRVNMSVQAAMSRFGPANDLALLAGTFTGWETSHNRSFVMTDAAQTLPAVHFNNVTSPPAPAAGAPLEFLAGADLSHLKFFEDRGVTYRASGQAGDALAILRDIGINCARLRLFTSSAAQAAADPYNFVNNLDYTLPLAARVKAAGLKLLLNFHYSDSWADPGKQHKPAAWTNLNFAQLTARLREYNSNTIAAFKAAGAMPDYVQIGNEITSGMLWNDGRVGGGFENATQWSQFARLLINAIQGVRDASGSSPPRIIIHIDRGGDLGATQWFFDRLVAQNVPFDIIGLSYYPFWHGTLDDLRNCLVNAAERYQKPVIIAETAFPFTASTNIHGIPATTNGQARFVTALAEVVRGLPGGRGAGIFWWGAEYQQLHGFNLAGFDRRSLFGVNGNVLPAAVALGRLSAPVALSASVTSTNLRLDWPLSGAGMTLVSTTSLGSATVWQTVTNAVKNTNLTYRATVPIGTGTGRYFRLRSN